MTDILVVVAHADDEALGCGGTIAKHAINGDNITLLVMTDGVSSRQLPIETNEKDKRLRQSALEQSCQFLGIKKFVQCDFPDNRMDEVTLLDIVQTIEKKCSSFAPQVIYTHSLNDLNIDHRITAQAVLTAFRPLPNSSVKTILSFEVLSSTQWQFSSTSFSPNWFVDISDSYSAKMQALQCYQGEMRAYPHPRSTQGVEALAKLRGSTIGVDLAEAFQLLRHRD